jgi:hypothetical protein
LKQLAPEQLDDVFLHAIDKAGGSRKSITPMKISIERHDYVSPASSRQPAPHLSYGLRLDRAGRTRLVMING